MAKIIKSRPNIFGGTSHYDAKGHKIGYSRPGILSDDVQVHYDTHHNKVGTFLESAGIQKLLKEAYKGEQTVLIENEFGEIAIDGGFLKEAGIEIKEMNSGCICCSLVGDFGSALNEVIDRYHPDRVIIEPSGVGKLSDVIKAVQKAGLQGDVVLNSYTTVADVNKCARYLKAYGEFFENQLQFAKVVILSRTDTPQATEEKVREAVDLIRSLNSECAIITTPIAKLDGKKILDTMEEGKKEFSLRFPCRRMTSIIITTMMMTRMNTSTTITTTMTMTMNMSIITTTMMSTGIITTTTPMRCSPPGAEKPPESLPVRRFMTSFIPFPTAMITA